MSKKKAAESPKKRDPQDTIYNIILEHIDLYEKNVERVATIT